MPPSCAEQARRWSRPDEKELPAPCHIHEVASDKDSANGGRRKVGRLELSPDVFEVEKALLAGEPFGGVNGAFGESATGLGVVAEIDPVGRGIEDQFVHADDVAFAKRGNLQLGSRSYLDDLLHGGSGTGRCVLLLLVMTLEDLAGILVLQRGGSGAGNVKKEIHADGKVCRIEKASSVLFHHLPDAREFVVPAGGAND